MCPVRLDASSVVALHSNGSSSICGLLTVNKGKESSAQQFSSGTTIHLALQSFEPIDLPLGLSVTPALADLGNKPGTLVSYS
jgi:hypothetical protein